MIGEKAAKRLAVEWTDLGACYLKALQSPFEGKRLRCGDYRLFFQYLIADRIQVAEVSHLREAYR